MTITSEQLRAARALVRWEQADLAEATGLASGTVKRLERAPGPLAAQARTVDGIVKAFEAVGVTFTSADGRACVCYTPKNG
ncbi:transcriptional regulator [Alsobacter soli]|uniref:Transcriptional regulator n=1 Tax=Alsobacter soli TaxID=2109933 RepID=A0A2T1HM05_9HYPH|nr:helix-turn-helix transcriptional regulator [Alsobacter soli]PSC02683.1 transcriptional regulator [Alsobacter soli]